MMQTWLRTKLDTIVQEFRSGHGTGAIFESTYLAYLECLVASTRGEAAAAEMWAGWWGICSEATPKPEKVQCLSHWTSDREELVTALRGHQSRFEGPTKSRFQIPLEAQQDPHKRSSDAEGLDLFDLLTGDE